MTIRSFWIRKWALRHPHQARSIHALASPHLLGRISIRHDVSLPRLIPLVECPWNAPSATGSSSRSRASDRGPVDTERSMHPWGVLVPARATFVSAGRSCRMPRAGRRVPYADVPA